MTTFPFRDLSLSERFYIEGRISLHPEPEVGVNSLLNRGHGLTLAYGPTLYGIVKTAAVPAEQPNPYDRRDLLAFMSGIKIFFGTAISPGVESKLRPRPAAITGLDADSASHLIIEARTELTEQLPQFCGMLATCLATLEISHYEGQALAAAGLCRALTFINESTY